MIEFDMPKTLDTTLHKARLYYDRGQLRKENMNINRYRSKYSMIIANKGLTHHSTGNKTTVFQ